MCWAAALLLRSRQEEPAPTMQSRSDFSAPMGPHGAKRTLGRSDLKCEMFASRGRVSPFMVDYPAQAMLSRLTHARSASEKVLRFPGKKSVEGMKRRRPRRRELHSALALESYFFSLLLCASGIVHRLSVLYNLWDAHLVYERSIRSSHLRYLAILRLLCHCDPESMCPDRER